jgi:hypothetical protein
MRHFRSRVLIHLAVALLMVTAQALLLIHEMDVEAHAHEATCEICIHYHHLGDSSSPSSFILPSLFEGGNPLQVRTQSSNDSATYPLTPPTRAPPVFSLTS